MKILAYFFLVLAALANAATPLQQAPPQATALSNPMQGDARAARAGGKLFARECSACHGANRQGIGKAPSLTRPAVVQAPSGAIFWVLRNGHLTRGMPSFAHLPEPQRWQIVIFLTEPRP